MNNIVDINTAKSKLPIKPTQIIILIGKCYTNDGTTYDNERTIAMIKAHSFVEAESFYRKSFNSKGELI